MRLLGKDVPVVKGTDGVALAIGRDGKQAPAAPVRNYLERAFGNRLGDVRKTLQKLAAGLPPDELNRVGFRLYDQFRPEVPEGVKGWGAKGELDLYRVRQALL